MANTFPELLQSHQLSMLEAMLFQLACMHVDKLSGNYTQLVIRKECVAISYEVLKLLRIDCKLVAYYIMSFDQHWVASLSTNPVCTPNTNEYKIQVVWSAWTL